MIAPLNGESVPPSRRTLRGLFLAAILLPAATALRAEFRISSNPISACAGTYTDTGGPSGSYGNSEDIIQTIWPAEPNTRVALSFTSFLSEVDYDLLTFYDGHNISAPSLGSFDGGIPPLTITSTAADGSLTLEWSSDMSNTAAGWEATISCVPAELREENSVEFTCDGLFTDSGGPDADYESFETYLLVVHPSRAGDRLEVDFSSFDTESGSDLLSVYDGTSTSDPLLGTFSGGAPPPTLRATSSGGALTFRFVSDGTVVGSGWRGTFRCAHPIDGLVAPPVKTCGGVAVDPGGSGGNYDNGGFALQTFVPADPGAKIELAFSSFSTEAGVDVLTIYDGSTTGAPLLGAFSGSSSPGLITSTAVDGALTFTWFSDATVTSSGWTADVACVFPISTGLVSACSSISTDTGGRGAPYGNNESFVQTFQTSRPWSEMRATVFFFSSENGFDVLTLRDGSAGAPVLGSLSGSPVPPLSWVATNPAGQLALDWSSDSTTPGTGWNALISCELPIFADGFEGRDFVQWSHDAP